MKAYFINDLHIDHWVKTQSKSGFSNVATYKKLLEKWCLPADALFIAGDVASSVNAIYATFSVLAKMYDHIFYCYGNHEMRLTEEDEARGLNTYTKRERIETFMETAVNKLDKLHIIKGSTAYVKGVRVSGGMGYADGRFSTDPETVEERWRDTNDSKKFNLGWASSMREIEDYENNSDTAILAADPAKVVMTHFAPYQLLDVSSYGKSFDPGLSTFDAKYMLEKVKSGSIWHFGHIHDKIKREVEVNGKSILAINNAVGTKEKKPINDIPREEFLLSL